MKMYGEDKLVKKKKVKKEKVKVEKAPKEKGKKRGVKVLVVFLAVIAALACVGGALWLMYVRAPDMGDTGWIDPTDSDLVEKGKIKISDTTRKDGIYNILIVGTDLNGYHTDSIMLASFNANTNKMNVLSIPRDTIINVRRSNKKINAAFAYDGNPGNVDKLYEELESVIGFKPDKYVIVSTQGFVDMIDAIGGVEVDVQQRMKYTDPTQDLYIDIEKGRQVLDGYDSMCFMRYRYGYVEGDVGRVRAQQQFVRALMDKMLTPETLSKLPELVEIVDKNVKTDLDIGNMVWLGTKVLDMNLETDLNTYILPGEGLYYQGLSYYFLYPNQTKELINEVFNPFVSPIEELDILNYTELTGKSFGGN